MPDYRQNSMMGRNYRNVMNGSRMMYGRPEPGCEDKKPKAKVKADSYELGMAYVPWQNWKETLELDQALCNGTIFPELVKKFECAGGGCR